MANTRTYSQSFAGGEISPEMWGRIGDAKYQSGAATMRNFIATPQGPAENRPGFAYVNATKGNGAARLIPFIYASDQAMVVEVGAGYFRFHTQGKTLLYGAAQRAWIVPTTVTISIGSPAVVSWASHGLQNGDAAYFGVPLHVPSFTLPAPLTVHTPYYVSVIDANSFSIYADPSDPTTLIATTAAGTAPSITGWKGYSRGELAAYDGQTWYYASDDASFGSQTPGNPGTQVAVWYQLPADLTYEVPNPYAAADLFDIHYAQSEDVMTLAHPSYPPSELRRHSASEWTFVQITFGPGIDPPANVTVTASPGYKAQVTGLTLASPGVFTTSANHNLVMGDGIYIDGLSRTVGGVTTDVSGFYLVNALPKDSSGNAIPNELTVMDYNGNVLDTSTWTSWNGPATIQFGSKIYDIDSYYAVTAIASDLVNQSVLSTPAHVINNLNVTGSYNTIAWDALANTSRYEVYKKRNGLWGYIGETTETSFVDNNIAPDLGQTPPNYDSVFTGPDDYPAAVGYFEQRKGYAGTNNKPQTLWMSRVGTEDNFSYSLPTTDADRIAATVATLQRNAIRHIVSLFQLLLLTDGAEIRVSPQNSDVLTPTTIGAKPQSYVGSSNVVPCIVNNTLVYCAARGGHVRELGFSFQANGFTGGFVSGDISLRAAHLFDNLQILDMTYQKSPRPILWFVSSAGNLLGLTYVPEEQIGAWHRHDTDGIFESVCAIPEGAEDHLYAVIQRTVNGQTVRYVERMASRLVDEADSSTWFFVDAGITQTFNAPVTNVTGLTWLEGKTVSILADGAVMPSQTVTGGAITLTRAATTVTIGLPITMDLETLPATLAIDGYGQGRAKNINKAWLRVFRSSAIFVGPDGNTLTEYKQRTTEPFGSPPRPVTDEVFVMTTPQWQQDGSVLIRQTMPLPLTVVGLTLEVAIGG